MLSNLKLIFICASIILFFVGCNTDYHLNKIKNDKVIEYNVLTEVKGSTFISPIETKVLPDDYIREIQGAGFTATGLVYDSHEQVYYVGNIGKLLPNSNTCKSSIVKLSKDFNTNLGEIILYTKFPNMVDIQGIAVDYSNDSLWFCSFGEDKVRNLSKDGISLRDIDIYKPIGICYESKSDALYVLTLLKLVKVSKDGKILKEIEVNVQGQDQLYLDETNNLLYFSAGNNYNEANYLYSINLETEEVEKKLILDNSYAIEGIHIDQINNLLYVVNDGLYHDAKIPKNIVVKYNLLFKQ